jgi:hypothetical protein
MLRSNVSTVNVQQSMLNVIRQRNGAYFPPFGTIVQNFFRGLLGWGKEDTGNTR